MHINKERETEIKHARHANATEQRNVGSNKKNTKTTDDNDMLNELNMAANSLSLIESL